MRSFYVKIIRSSKFTCLSINISFLNVAQDVYAAVELQGQAMAVQTISMQALMSPLRPCSVWFQDTLHLSLRRHTLDEFNNGVFMAHRPLHDNELFGIRIVKLVDNWSESIEVYDFIMRLFTHTIFKI